MEKKKSILVVDDNNDILNIIKKGLELRGYSVDTASDPVLASSTFRAGAYNIVLVDYRMPSMDGFDLFEKISEIDKKAKVCFLTAWELELEDRLKALIKNGHIVIKKPVTLERLDSQLKELMKN